MSKGALIVGGSIAGMQAALDLARSGIQVHLIESAPFLGLGVSWGTPGALPATEHGAPDVERADGVNGSNPAVPHHLLNARMLEVTKHPNVTVWTNTRLNRFAGEGGRFQIELREHPRYVDLARCTACNDCVEVCPVTVPGTDHKAIYLVDGGQPGCAVITKQGKAPCSNTCPGGIHVQGYIALVAQGRFREALDLIYQAIPFPGICGRICTHPCELNCRRMEVDEAVSIRLLKRFLSDWAIQNPEEAAAGASVPADPPPADAQPNNLRPRVAVIGAGPAGMAVADNMVRRGYRVTVFEAQPVVGGMMAMGIPAYRLPRDVIQREVARIQKMGVELQLSSPIGPSGKHTLDDLFAQGYKAIFVGVGAHQSHQLRLPGEDLRGVVAGLDLLKAISLSQQTDDPRWQTKLHSYLLGGVPNRVAIIGGGNTAMDVARSLKRLGVEDVRILYRRTRAEMPALPEEVDEAEHEGIPIEFLVSPVRIVGDEQGRVAALECVRMKLGEPDPSGRRRPVPIAGSEFSLQVDMVVPAIGQSPDLSFLGDEHAFSITREGTFNIDRVSFMTNHPGVFAAGDAITQPVSVIDAIGSAKQAAAGMDAYLRGVEVQEVPVSDRQVPISRRELAPEELVPKPRHPAPTLPMAQRMRSHAEVELGYDAETAMAEARRCLMCGPCSECLACEVVCEPRAIVHDQQERLERIEVGALIWADKAAAEGSPAVILEQNGEPEGVYRVVPDDPLSGSAAAARVMMELFAERHWRGGREAVAPDYRQAAALSAAEAARIGVFVCRCNGQISDIVDTEAVQAQADTWQGVVYSQVLAHSCSPEAADAIYQAVAEQDLNRVVLAACSCCAVDQVCYSCDYQRVRCKENLLGRYFDRANPLFEFVNIREECAWAHEADPAAATSTAAAMVAAAVAKTRLSAAQSRVPVSLDNRVLILGNGPAAAVCQGALSAQRIQALRLKTTPWQIRQTSEHFCAVDNGSVLWTGSALVLAPSNEGERSQINDAFGTAGRQPRTYSRWGRVDTHRPGIFICEPELDPALAGMAAAARAAAWLNQEHFWPQPPAAVVTPDRCRGCGDCEQICEFGAIHLQGEGEVKVAWIDPAICRGCGVCVPRCPVGAISTGHLGSTQIEAMLEAILA